MNSIITTDIAVIGAGTSGLAAFNEITRAGRAALLIDRGPLGTTCARVGCMPSKAGRPYPNSPREAYLQPARHLTPYGSMRAQRATDLREMLPRAP
jgi:pyruvate/2-oxoglutarate dehydrogenase complex dihydrolipoamide dehydrogenase (E3) component